MMIKELLTYDRPSKLKEYASTCDKFVRETLLINTKTGILSNYYVTPKVKDNRYIEIKVSNDYGKSIIIASFSLMEAQNKLESGDKKFTYDRLKLNSLEVNANDFGLPQGKVIIDDNLRPSEIEFSDNATLKSKNVVLRHRLFYDNNGVEQVTTRSIRYGKEIDEGERFKISMGFLKGDTLGKLKRELMTYFGGKRFINRGA